MARIQIARIVVTCELACGHAPATTKSHIRSTVTCSTTPPAGRAPRLATLFGVSHCTGTWQPS
ncbi:MAG: hypothetical protein GYA36_17250 [Veillonellaceae bacterium]|nr:hypothetical protein [Veillonellaceae bacterium]